MVKYVSENQLLEVQQATDIVQLISEYIPLKKAGNNYKALCPFHDEKNPSFMVSPNKQIYHCFGCHKGGNVFTFLMEIEKISFSEAVKILAERNGIKLVDKERAGFSEEKRAELLEINRLVAEWYHKNLLETPEGEISRRYLAQRGFNQEMIAKFLLGYAKSGWDTLINFARNKNISLNLLEELGLIIPRKEINGYYDRFRNRLIFPICNLRGRVIGFGARALDDNLPVYLNSPEGPLFSKGKTLYGLNFAKNSLALQSSGLIIVEGYTDVIMAHQMGFDNVVASLGTALTDDHLKLIRRFVDKVTLVYDADSAGEMASARTLDLFLKEKIDLLIAELPKALDPYDCLVQKGQEFFRKCLNEAKDLFSYRLDGVKKRYNLSSRSGIIEKTRAVDEMLETIMMVNDEYRRELMIKRLAEEMNIREPLILWDRLKKISTFKQRNSTQKSDNVPLLNSKFLIAAEDIIELMLLANEVIPQVAKTLTSDDFPDELTRKIYQEIVRLYEKYERVTIENLSTILSPDPQVASRLVEIVQQERVKSQVKSQNDYQKRLKNLLSYFDRERKMKTKPPLKSEKDLDERMKVYRQYYGKA